MKRPPFVKVYNGYGHEHNLHVFGHVLERPPAANLDFRGGLFKKIFSLLKLFFVHPLPAVPLRLRDGTTSKNTETASDGFFKFEWAANDQLKAGWHDVIVEPVNGTQAPEGGKGKVFIPHITQFAFISDIDDTIMISHSSTVGRRLRELFTKGPLTRKIFSDVALHYELLAAAHTTREVPNPFFYVSSSEWNLYNYLTDFFRHHNLPEGVFLLSQIKRWFELWKTGKTKHEGKLLRIVRVIETFPKQKFVLFGDNSQSDPLIYSTLAKRLPGKIFAIYIRNVNAHHVARTDQVLAECFQDGVHTCHFRHSREAIAHSRSIGLLNYDK